MTKSIGVLLGAVACGLLGFITSAVINWHNPSTFWPLLALILATFASMYGTLVGLLLAFVDEKLNASFTRLLAAGFGCSNVVYFAMVVADIGKGTSPAPNYFDPSGLLAIALLGIAVALGFYLGTRTIPRWLESR